jgi:hypothetical protein
MSRFVHFDEAEAGSFQNKPLQRKDIARVAIVASNIKYNHLGPGLWYWDVHKGSVTLLCDTNPGQVVKVFVDYGSALAIKCGLELTQSDPIVVGMELTNQAAFVRDTLRDRLAKDFKYYVDPRTPGCSKWWLKPVDSHKYDILFLEVGSCELPLDELEFHNLRSAMENEIHKHELGGGL